MFIFVGMAFDGGDCKLIAALAEEKSGGEHCQGGRCTFREFYRTVGYCAWLKTYEIHLCIK